MQFHHPLTIATALLLMSITAVAAPDSRRQAQLEHLLTQDCGACHGLHMTGGLGPELTHTALASKSRDGLVVTVALGRPGTAMPGWAPLLSDEDIHWLVDRLLKGYPAP